MGNGSSKYSSRHYDRHYDYRPFTGPVIPPPSQMTHANSNATTGSTFPSFDMPRRKRKWYRFGAGRDRHRGQDVWYSAYVSPRGQQPPPLNMYGAYQRPPDQQRNPSMPVPMTAQYGSLYIPDGYIPSSVNPPVVPHDARTPGPDPAYWMRPTHSPQHSRDHSQGHYRRPSQSYPPVQQVEPAVIPSRPFTERTTTTPTSATAASPPFKPFGPLPEIRRSKPPTPPQKLLDLAPYRETFAHLSNPTPRTRSKALEIVNNKDKRNITLAREEWRRQDEEREREIREKREQRERLVSGANTIQAPTMQTVTALVVDPTNIQQPFVPQPQPQPPPPPPPKEKKPFWRKFFHPSGRPAEHTIRQVLPVTTMPIPTQAGGPVIIPLGPQHALPSVPGVVVPVQIVSQSQTSSSPTQQSSSQFQESTRAPPVIPRSPSRRYTGGAMSDAVGSPMTMPRPFMRSTTPNDRPPPTAAFFSVPGAPDD